MADVVQHDGVAVGGYPSANGYRVGARARSEAYRRSAVERVIAVMRERLDRPLSLQDMARLACLSPFYFNRVFRQLTGVPPGRFHTALRMAAAKRLLLTTDLSVTEVCFELGYQSLGTFTTHFHNLVGVSPRELRQLASGQAVATAALAGSSPLDGGGSGPAVEGTVSGADASGLVFVGVFADPYPQGAPAGCTAAPGSGSYALRAAAEGSFYVAAAAFAPSDDRVGCLLADGRSTLVARSDAPVRLACGRPVTCNLRLRPVESTDPPILLALPLALAHDLARSRPMQERIAAPA